MTEQQVKLLARHIPTDEFPAGVSGITDEDWLIVGPRCLELWWQFKGKRLPPFIDPYVRRIVMDSGRKQ